MDYEQGQGAAVPEAREAWPGWLAAPGELQEKGPRMKRLADWWFLSSLRRALLCDPAKIDAYNAAVDRYNAAI